MNATPFQPNAPSPLPLSPDGERGSSPRVTAQALAELVGVPVAMVRRWLRKSILRPVEVVHRLAYFDFREVHIARRLAEMLAAGVSAREIERQAQRLGNLAPQLDRPLADLPLVVEDGRLMVRRDGALSDAGGQLRLQFDAESAGDGADTEGDGRAATIAVPSGPADLCRMAAELEDDGQLAAAAEMYRAAMAAGGPKADLCFVVAELLYRLGDLAGARERYYMAIELNEDYVEARANLGCVLMELGQFDLAVAAFEGALRFHPDYADAHLHLARALERLGRSSEAEEHRRLSK